MGARLKYNVVFAKREVWQEGKGEVLIYKQKATKIRPRNAKLLQKKKNHSLSVLFSVITQKEHINCNPDSIVNTHKSCMGTTRLVNVPLNCQNNFFKTLQTHKH